MVDARSAGRTPLARRFLVVYSLFYLILIGLTGLLLDLAIRNALVEDVADDLEKTARLSQAHLIDHSDNLETWAAEIVGTTGYRATLIDVDGVVLADSHIDPAVMENHASRPEVIEALAGEVGRSRRVSASTGFDQVYVALPPVDGLVVRISVPVFVIDGHLAETRRTLVLTLVGVGLVGIGLAALLARRMARPITELTEKAKAVARGVPQVAARRSAVREIDQLGVAISEIATVLGSRLDEAETATDTLEVVLGALPVGTILVGEDDDLTYANDAARELIGTIPERLEQLSPHPLQATARAVRTSHAVEARVFEMGKPPRQLRVLATPFAEDPRVLLTIADITARERADAVRRDFVANASHELKTPVATIIAASEALQIAISRGDESAVSFSSQIEMSARQLDRLVTDLLDLSRLEREKPELSPVRLDLLVREEVERLRSRAEENDLSIEVKVVEATAMASRRDIAIAIRNLLDNAVRYTPSGGSIGVGLDLSDGQVVLTVRDTGDGVPTRDLERIFERFYRVDSARSRSTGGTGLGLSIVKHVVESHGGTVGVESELGAGSVFTVRLPLADEGQPTDPN